MDATIVIISRHIDAGSLIASIGNVTPAGTNRFLLESLGHRVWIDLAREDAADIAEDYSPRVWQVVESRIIQPQFIVISSHSVAARTAYARQVIRALACLVDMDQPDDVLMTGEQFLSATGKAEPLA